MILLVKHCDFLLSKNFPLNEGLEMVLKADRYSRGRRPGAAAEAFPHHRTLTCAFQLLHASVHLNHLKTTCGHVPAECLEQYIDN